MANLCTRIHSVKLGRRILQHWNRQAIQRLVPAATRCAALYQRNTLKSHYALWRTFFAQRGFQVQKNAVLQASKKRRIFGQWRSYVGLSKQSRRIFRTMERRVLQPIWQKWRAKVSILSVWISFIYSVTVRVAWKVMPIFPFILTIHICFFFSFRPSSVPTTHAAVPGIQAARPCLAVAAVHHAQ
jgi:hypothetical protein